MTVIQKTIGRLPVNLGDYDSTKSYGKKNRVLLYGCEWESKVENNTYAPASLNTTTGVITPDTTHWKLISGSYNTWLIDNGYKKVDAANVKDGNNTQHEINNAVANEIGTDSTPSSIKGRVTNLESAVGSGGSVDSRIASAVNTEKNRAVGVESGHNTRIEALETAVGSGGSVDSRISSAVAAETARAQAAEADRYTKSETYTKTEVNGLVDTPHQEYVTVDAYSNLPATGSKDTIYRVSNYNGSTSQVDASVYSEYAWNGTQYIFLCVKSQIGEVFDISAYNNNAKYANLAAALNGGANIPQSLQKGGMSVKFVQTSDNKYVQFRLMSDTFSTTESDWQGVDDRLLPVSRNLVENGIVAKTIGVPVEIRHENSSGASYFANLKAGEIYKVTTSRTIGYATRNVIGGSTIQTGFFAEGDNTFTVTGDALYLSLGTFTVVEQIDVTLSLENSIIDRIDNVEDKTEFSYNKVNEALTFNGDTTFRYGAVYTNGNIAEGWASHDRAITEVLNVNGDVSVELLNATSTILFAVCGKYIGETFVEITPQLYFTNNKCVIPYNGEYDRLVLTIKPSTGTISEEELRALRLHCVYITGGLANTNETKKIKEYRYNIGFDFDLTKIPTPTMYSSDVIRSNDLDAYNGYWEALRLQYPQYITKIDSSVTDTQFGITRPAYLTNMPIYMYKFIPKQKSGQTTLNSDTIKVMLVLGTHSQERGGMFGCLQLMQYICEGWKNDINAMMMRTSVEFYVITCLNPWGYANTGVVPYAGRINYNEVNINRNFPTPNWRSDESSKAYYNYEGDSPASEYETKTMMAFFDIVKPNIFIDVHTSGSLNTGEIGTFEFYNNKIKNDLFLIADEFTARVSADNRDYPDNPDNALIKIAKIPDSPSENGEHGTLAYYFGNRNLETVSTLIECMGEQSYWSNGVYDTTQPAQGHTAKSMRECMQWQWCILQRLIDAYSKKIE